ncbi:hypothetical protein Mapa_011522 [Marchantia paleacea]|nr:hypothetical protein Mapa_011522 [Marchantia paleacea]
MVKVNQMAVLQVATITLVVLGSLVQEAKAVNAWEVTSWTPSHATFYGDDSGSATMGGACGYGNLWWRGYGLATAALSDTLLNNGLTCGACFEIKCNITGGESGKWCIKSNPSIKITATNQCPPNWDRPTDNGGWCNPPRTHFDLSLNMFRRLAQTQAGIIPISYRRTKCIKTGGIRFYLGGNPYFNLVLVYNVGGWGDVMKMQMRGSKTGWITMKRNWGQNWESSINYTGQSLSFIVTLGNGEVRVIRNLTPTEWYHKQTYEADTNF